MSLQILRRSFWIWDCPVQELVSLPEKGERNLRHRHRKDGPEDRGRQWSVGATSPGAPRIASGHQKLGGRHAIDALCRESIF